MSLTVIRKHTLLTNRDVSTTFSYNIYFLIKLCGVERHEDTDGRYRFNLGCTDNKVHVHL